MNSEDTIKDLQSVVYYFWDKLYLIKNTILAKY